MAQRPSWNSVYEGSPPWDIGRPQPSFVMLADAGKFQGRVLDVLSSALRPGGMYYLMCFSDR
ncbi:MAG: hypothetical protein QOG08_175 [Chloroflexota bacterium]|nr:hypothetical protein [Chloroflexota bacterium]